MLRSIENKADSSQSLAHGGSLLIAQANGLFFRRFSLTDIAARTGDLFLRGGPGPTDVSDSHGRHHVALLVEAAWRPDWLTPHDACSTTNPTRKRGRRTG